MQFMSPHLQLYSVMSPNFLDFHTGHFFYLFIHFIFFWGKGWLRGFAINRTNSPPSEMKVTTFPSNADPYRYPQKFQSTKILRGQTSQISSSCCLHWCTCQFEPVFIDVFSLRNLITSLKESNKFSFTLFRPQNFNLARPG